MARGEGSTRAWRRARAKVLDRDDHRCRIRIPGVCVGHATEVHHVVGIAETRTRRRDATDPEQCIAACPPCHAVITKQQTQEGRARRTGRRRPPMHPSDYLSAGG